MSFFFINQPASTYSFIHLLTYKTFIRFGSYLLNKDVNYY